MSRRCMPDGHWEQQTNYDQCAPYMRPLRPEDNPLFDESLIESHRHVDMVSITDQDPFAEVLIHMALWPTLLSMLEWDKWFIINPNYIRFPKVYERPRDQNHLIGQ